MEKNKKLYIVLTRSGLPISSIVQKFHVTYYTHAGIALDKELTKLYTFGTLFTLDPFHTGLKKESIYKDFYTRKPYIPVKVLEIPVTQKQYCGVCRAINWIKQNNQRFSFNTIGMFFYLLGIKKERPDKFFCSEFVYTILKEVGIVDWNKPRHYVMPDDFEQIDKVQTVFEGKLISLQSQLAEYHGEIAVPYLFQPNSIRTTALPSIRLEVLFIYQPHCSAG